MFTVSRALFAAKDGNTPDQYEDAFAFDESASRAYFTVCVSDGASSAGYAREWANRLVNGFVADEPFPETDVFFARVQALGTEWRREVSGGATSWYAQEKLASGSAATLLHVRFDAAQNRVDASCVGDVCLFLVRKDKLRFGFPLTHSKGFSNHPDLLSTEELGTRRTPTVAHFSTAIEPGDRFFLFTDALAQYFLTRFETRRERPWHKLPQTQDELAPWLAEARSSGAMKNDDVTLIEIVYEPM